MAILNQLHYLHMFGYIFTILEQYEHELNNHLTLSSIVALLSSVQSIIGTSGEDREDIKINIIYTSEAGQKITVNLSTDNYEDLKSSEEMRNLWNEIRSENTYLYNVELQTYSNDINTCNIVITPDN